MAGGSRARATVAATEENGRVQGKSEFGVDDIVAVLASGAPRPLGPGQRVTQLEHALQTAAI